MIITWKYRRNHWIICSLARQAEKYAVRGRQEEKKRPHSADLHHLATEYELSAVDSRCANSKGECLQLALEAAVLHACR